MIRSVFFLLLLFLCPQEVGAATPSALADFLARLDARVAGVDSFTCDFRQERHLKLFRKPVVFTGTLTVARPRKLAWTMVSPVASRLIIDNDHGIRCVDGRAHRFDLASDPVMAAVTNQMWSFVNGSFASLPPGWELSLTGESTVEIRPKGGGVFFSRIAVSFDPRELRPVQVELGQENGDRTIIRFHDYRPAAVNAFNGCGE